MQRIYGDIKVVLTALAVFNRQGFIFVLSLFDLLWRDRNGRVGLPQILT